MQIEHLTYILHVKDMKRALIFYRDVMGLKLQSESSHWTEFSFGSMTIALQTDGTFDRVRTGLSFNVRDIESVCNDIGQGGGTVISAPAHRPGEPVMLANVLDTEGNELMITEYIGNAPSE